MCLAVKATSLLKELNEQRRLLYIPNNQTTNRSFDGFSLSVKESHYVP